MTQPLKPRVSSSNDAKGLLSALRMTTTVGALSLTLAGWGLLARVDALAAAQTPQDSSTGLLGVAPAAALPTALPVSGASSTTGSTLGLARAAAVSAARARPTAQASLPIAAATLPIAAATSTAAPTAAPTDTPAPTATPQTTIKLDVVQWVQTRAGDPVAVVRDRRNVLWYVWGPDVERIEQGLTPQYDPQPVDSVTRTRQS